MTRLELLNKVVNRKKDLGLTNANISSLGGITQRTIMRFFAGDDVKLSTVEKITNILGLDFAGNEVIDINTLKHNRAREKALYLVSLVQDTSSLEKQGLDNKDLDLLVQNAKNELLTGKYQKQLWAN